jgi:beta-lactamase regulating signal transducer with metallopeptidase domain
MNRYLLLFATGISATVPWLIDSTLKSIMVLIATGLAAIALRRASAAKRHLLWLIAMTALLALPILSILLPTWRILPPWSSRIVYRSIAATTPVAAQRFIGDGARARGSAGRTPAVSPATPRLDTHSGSAPSIDAWSALSLVWAAGSAVLLLRLCAAQCVLRRTFKRCSPATHDRVLGEVQRARAQLGLRRTVLLLSDPRQTIPFVSGVWRPRLVLPAESEQWSDVRMRSVLLHELAHIKRNDIAIQWLAQVVCAVHWFNPLVWFAAWRLHVERERACDDLVLASGVRASDYAEHLLHVATKLEPAIGTYSSALAMARPSRLEGRLVDVLNARLNRSGVTRTLAVGAVAIAIALIVPIAMLRAAEEKPASDPAPVSAGSSDLQQTLDPPVSSQEIKESHAPDPTENPQQLPPKAIDAKILELRGSLEELRTQLGDMHPKVREMRARIAQLEAHRNAQTGVGAHEARIANETEEKALARLRLQQAELELKRAAELHEQKMISAAEYEKAKAALDLRRAELRGDQTEVARVELARAEAQLARLSELRRQKLISESELEEAKFAVEEARIRLRQREVAASNSKPPEETRFKAVRKVPVLGDIPVLGRLFRTTTEEDARKREEETAYAAGAAGQPGATTPNSKHSSPPKSEIRVVALKYCEASATAPLIEQAMTAQKRAVHVLPDARSNSLVIVADDQAIDAAVRFIATLDQAPRETSSAIDPDPKPEDKGPEAITQAVAAQKALVDAARARLQQAEAELTRLNNLREEQGGRH